MGNQPDGQNLLLTARRVLLEEILPILPDESRYTTMMLANAMGIAARELDAEKRSDLEEEKSLGLFLIEVGVESGQKVDCDNAAMLADLIRQRSIPDRWQQPLAEMLLALTRRKLQISNPKYLSL
ncbi:hypothetical protein W822_03740 [Advenella kashmirensis W13003]|uniref:DUF6285 domain-containing protein n=1 Tax=Advenella kashmirensis W13003 TaxID=1424334 RepID=V8QWH5_9BURK|nr:DUF6285 domain-containing protein [Advenella kashmirensis]ETF04291.1 hypothetical protein W822_03740 [Advenella kashmirensis W13003]